MILVKVYGERTDVTAYLSYYAKEEIKVLTEARDEEIFFETVVSGYCLDGDLVEVNQLMIEVVMDSKYADVASNLAGVLNYYGTYFTNNVYVYFSLKDDNLAFSYVNQEKKDFDGEGIEFVEDDECHCREGGECTCGDECHCHDERECHCKEGGECTCGEECHCHEGKCNCGCECHCHEGGECTCGEDCKCRENGGECHCHEGKCNCGCECHCHEGGECTCGDDCKCKEKGDECHCHDNKCHCEGGC